MTRQEVLNRIQKDTEFWYSFVGSDHHKDRDCHWHIDKVWSYGAKPKYTAWHNGYIFDGDYIECETEEEAENALANILSMGLHRELDWGKRVLEDVEDWDSDQIKKAIDIIKYMETR